MELTIWEAILAFFVILILFFMVAGFFIGIARAAWDDLKRVSGVKVDEDE